MDPLSVSKFVLSSSCILILLLFLLPLAQAAGSDASQASASGAVTLASDIAPLIQLFGAGPLIQFLAHSLGSKRGMLSLFGTVGIVTAMTVYIRVHSHSWMRYMIGRAGETAGEALTEVYKLPQQGTAVLWTGRGGRAMGSEGRAVVVMKLKELHPGKSDRRHFGATWSWGGNTHANAGDLLSKAEKGRSKSKVAANITVSDPSLLETPSLAVDPVNRVVEAWPQVTSSTISRSRSVTVGGAKMLLCCTTALGGATLRSKTGRRRVAGVFYILCLSTVVAQGALAYFMWKASVQRWLIISSHALYYITFAILLWRLLSVDKRRSARERLRDVHKMELESLFVLQPGVLSDDATMPERVSFPESLDLDFVMYPQELDAALASGLGLGQDLNDITNKSNLREASDSILLACLVVGYLLYFTALSSMKTLETFLVLAAIGPSLVAKGLMNTVEASRVRPDSIKIAAGRSDVACVLIDLLTPHMNSADMTWVFINLVLQMKLQPVELEPALSVQGGLWISFVSVPKGHRRYSPLPLFAFETSEGSLPLGLLVRLWLIAGDVTPHVDLPDRIAAPDWNDEAYSRRGNGAGPEHKTLLNNWAKLDDGPGFGEHRPVTFRINGNWYRGRLSISRHRPGTYIQPSIAQQMARAVKLTETTLEYALLERDWMQATGSRGWDPGSRHGTVTPRMLNTLDLEYGVKVNIRGESTAWDYSGDARSGSREGEPQSSQ